MSRKCILLHKTELNWEYGGIEKNIEAIGPFDNWDHAGEWREYLGQPLSDEYVIVKLKSAISKQKELDKKLWKIFPFDPKPFSEEQLKEMKKLGIDKNINLNDNNEPEPDYRAADHLDEVKDIERINEKK